MARGFCCASCFYPLLCLLLIMNSSQNINSETLSPPTVDDCSVPNPSARPIQHHHCQQPEMYGDITCKSTRITASHNSKHNIPGSESKRYTDHIESSCEKSNTESKNSPQTKCDSQNSISSCSQTIPHPNPSQFQLVPYKPSSKILPMFHEKTRVFDFAGKQWTIMQQWDEIGVASVVWEAALLLSQYLETLGSDFLKGKRVIELGAGTGLVGMVASSLGAHSVVITDKIPGPAEANLKLNMHHLINSIKVLKLEWGSDVSDFGPPFDVILAADVIYIEETYPLLIKTLDELSDGNTVILMSCKRRYDRDDRFFKLLHETANFSSEVVEVCSKVDNVKVYRIKKL